MPGRAHQAVSKERPILADCLLIATKNGKEKVQNVPVIRPKEPLFRKERRDRIWASLDDIETRE